MYVYVWLLSIILYFLLSLSLFHSLSLYLCIHYLYLSLSRVLHVSFTLSHSFSSLSLSFTVAAYAMFEYGLRLGRESSDPKSLQKQVCQAIHEDSVGIFSITNPKPTCRGQPSHWNILLRQTQFQRKAEPFGCLALRTRVVIYMYSEYFLFDCTYMYIVHCMHVQANCYAATLNALSLTEEKYAWVIKPVEPDEVCIITGVP